MSKAWMIPINFKALGNGFSAFDLDGVIYGLLSYTDDEYSKSVDVILTDGITSFYVLGETDFRDNAVYNICELYTLIMDADKDFGMDYSEYKKLFSSGVNLEVRH